MVCKAACTGERPEPAAIATAYVNAYMHITGTETKIHTPSCPGVIGKAKPPGHWPGIIDGSIPGIIIKTGAIYDRWPIHIAAHVSRRIAHIYILRRAFIDIDVLGIIRRAAGRYGFYIFGPGIGYGPGPLRGCPRKPHPIIQGKIVSGSIPHHGEVGILSELEAGAFD